MRAVWLAFALAGCVEATPPVLDVMEELPPGYPPKLGDVVGVLDGKSTTWTTYDYSVGAYDASVQIRGAAAKPEFHLDAEPPGKTEGSTGALVLSGLVGRDLKAGVLSGALVEVWIGEGKDNPRYSSFGQTAEIVLDEVTDTDEPMRYGHMKGHFSAHMCSARGGSVGSGAVPVMNLARCLDVEGHFDSDFQYDIYN